ncbi:GntR family transcriptional regulator [Brevibacterium sp. UCMA 11754]|uniref:GntR family transcriptional regulator n=1 Tax=Brevibacterium sp. UCMA 11754 TaxID=2749198 RepID=UPI001F1AF131|nr:GntR family transcriptional regulator [Brevibacterium sp. UCMA 11754]MCF2570804.1 GntR family transcriptional regulator [Brevibacterium sp. UCMA 11754]
MPSNSSRTISRPSIPSQAEEILRGMIIDGTLGPGERLNEVALAESIGISRGPLREAIKRLSGQGYLKMETHRGSFVRSYEPQEIIDLYELRAALELYAVRLAVERASDNALEVLDDRLVDEQDRVRRHAESADEEPYASELDFHQQLVALGGNHAISEQLSDANHRLFLALRPTHRTEIRKGHAVASHRDVLEHVRAREADAAVALLSTHLTDSMSNSLHVLGLSDSDAEDL